MILRPLLLSVILLLLQLQLLANASANEAPLTCSQRVQQGNDILSSAGAACTGAAELEAETVALRDAHLCTLERIDARSFSATLFFARYYNRVPFVLTNYSAAIGSQRAIDAARARELHESFRARSSEERLLARYGHETVLASAGSTYSHTRRAIPFATYVAHQRAHPLTLDADPEQVGYFFGDHDDPNNFDDDAELDDEAGDNATRCNQTNGTEQERGGAADIVTSPDAERRPVWAKLLRHYPPAPFVLPHVLAEERAATASAATSTVAAAEDESTGGVRAHPLPSAAAQRALFDQGDLDATLRARGARPASTLPPRFDFLRYSFGLGGHRSGVPFHFHGGALAEVLHGRKRWFIYPPQQAQQEQQQDGDEDSSNPFDGPSASASRPLPFPSFRPELSQLQWLAQMYPLLSESERPLQCTLGPGELVYIPAGHMHATTNLGPLSVFVSTFLDERRMEAVMRAQTGVEVGDIAEEVAA